MHDVEAHVAGTCYAEHRVEVGSVVIHQAAGAVNHVGYARNLGLEESESVGVGHHHGGHGVVEQRGEGFGVDGAVGTALDLYDLKAADGCRCGVGAVGAVGHDYFRALAVAALVVVGAYDHESGQLAVGAGEGVEGELAEAADFAQRALQAPVGLEGTLGVDGVGCRVEAREAGHRGDSLVDFRVIFHCARAQRIEAAVDAEVVGRHACVVAHYCRLVDLGEVERGGAAQCFGECRSCRGVGVGKTQGRAARARELEDELAVYLSVHGRSVGLEVFDDVDKLVELTAALTLGDG